MPENREQVPCHAQKDHGRRTLVQAALAFDNRGGSTLVALVGAALGKQTFGRTDHDLESRQFGDACKRYD